jgi:hypothetical protein
MKKTDKIWLVWAKWDDGSWDVWPNIGCAKTRHELDDMAVTYFVDNAIWWALNDDCDKHSRRIRLVKHDLSSLSDNRKGGK